MPNASIVLHPPYRPRQWVPSDLDLGRPEAVEPEFERLANRLPSIGNPKDLEAWLLDWSELSSAVEEESSRRYIAMTCHTDDAVAEKAYLTFMEDMEPMLKRWQFRLASAYLEHPDRPRLREGRLALLDRDLENRVALFREENVPLETEESRVCQQYQKLSGSLTVKFLGEERTLVQMARFLEEEDPAVRRASWEASAQRRLSEADTFEAQFESLLGLRERMADNAGFRDYRDFAFRQRGRFDYGPHECLAFHDAVEKEVLPLLREVQENRRQRLGQDTLRPWDLAVDPDGRPPLRPFSNAEELSAGCRRIFERIDAGLAEDYRSLEEKGLLDLENRKSKAPGGYQCCLDEARLPFIFMNAVGVQRDVETLLHEAGHAFHSLAVRNEDLLAYRHPPLEFCEVASMAMELLGADHLEEYYGPESADRARLTHLEGVLGVFPWIATVDSFQHWIYTHPGHGRAERRAAWLERMDRFGGLVDWAGYEDIRGSLWHRQLHIFLHPFYYIEYGMAQVGALQVWTASRRDRPAALQAYRQGLALGGARPLPELFQAAGCRFDFSRPSFRPLMETVRQEWRRLSQAVAGRA